MRKQPEIRGWGKGRKEKIQKEATKDKVETELSARDKEENNEKD